MAALRVGVGVSLVAGLLIAGAGCGVDHPGLAPHSDAGSKADRPMTGADAAAPMDTATHRAPDGGTPPVVMQPPLCEPDGWCWVNPLPQGRRLIAVWGSSPRDVWASLETPGMFLHRGADGTWAHVASGADIEVRAIWGTGPSSVWAVGANLETLGPAGAVLHWDGARWSEVFRTQEILQDVHGSAPDDVWAVGPLTVAHFDGSAWRLDETASALLIRQDSSERVAVTARDDVWIASGQTVLRWNGAAWRSEDAGAGGLIMDIWASGPDSAFRALTRGSLQAIERWDGSAWQPSLAADQAPAVITALSGTAPNDVWALDIEGRVYHLDGSIWTIAVAATGMFTTGLWADQPGVAMTVGSGGEIHELAGGVWRRVTRGSSARVAEIRGSGPQNVWFGGTALLRWDGSALREVPLPPGAPAATIMTVWVPDEYTVWVGGTAGLLAIRDGTTWTTFSIGSDEVRSIWGAKPDDAWMTTLRQGPTGAEGQVFHWDGIGWSPVDFPFDFLPSHVHGTAVDDVWVGGSQRQYAASAVARWDGRGWTLLPPGGGGDIWVNAPDDVWSRFVPFYIPGDTVNHFDGTSWTRLRFWDHESVGDVWSPGAGEAFVGGRNVHHFESGVWTDTPSPGIDSIWGSSRNDIWGAGGFGGILRRRVP